MEIIKTISNDEKSASCLICDTTNHKGKRIFSSPKCKCGNIEFFDIIEDYVRFGFNWYQIKASSKRNWQTEVLDQIYKNGKPNHVIAFKDEKENEVFDFNKYIN